MSDERIRALRAQYPEWGALSNDDLIRYDNARDKLLSDVRRQETDHAAELLRIREGARQQLEGLIADYNHLNSEAENRALVDDVRDYLNIQPPQTVPPTVGLRALMVRFVAQIHAMASGKDASE